MSADDEDVRKIERKAAKSGQVSYSDPVVLHETSRQRIVMVPFFIPRSEGIDLAVNIVTHRKGALPMEWVVSEEKSVSLNEGAARRLLRGLREHLAVAEENKDGSYLLIRVSEGTAQLGEHDPAAVASALAKVLSQKEILQHLGEAELSDELVKAFRGALRLNEMHTAVSQL